VTLARFTITAIIAATVYHFGGILMNYVHRQKEKTAVLSLRGVALSSASVLLSASFLTFFLSLVAYIFGIELVSQVSISIFSTILALMIGVEVTNEDAPDPLLFWTVIIFLFLIGLVLWPITYFLFQLLDETFTSVTLFGDIGIIEFSVWMIGLTRNRLAI